MEVLSAVAVGVQMEAAMPMSIDAKMSEKEVTVTEVVVEAEEEETEQESDAAVVETTNATTSPRAGTPVLTPPAQETTGAAGEMSPGPRHQAAFVNKLYTMVEDPSNSEVMWSESGLTFIVTSPIEFSKRLHNYFKHNNWQSFVRQLNMYQFHKVNDVFHANPNANSTSAETAAWEFKHPYFQRDRVDLLANIKRKASRPLPLSRDSYQEREHYGFQSPHPHPYEHGNTQPRHPMHQHQQQHQHQHQQPYSETQRMEHVIDVLEQRIHGMEESQRLLMDQTANVFSTLRAYHGILSGVSNILAAVQPDENSAALQADLAALHQQMTTSQFAPRRMAANGMHIAMPARPMTFGAQAVYTPGSTPSGWSHPGTPTGFMQTPLFSPNMRPSPDNAGGDSYFRQVRPVPQQQQQNMMVHQSMYASQHPIKSPTWGTAILSPPLSDTSRGTLSPFPDGKYTSQARHDRVNGSLQSLLNKNEELEDSRKRRKGE